MSYTVGATVRVTGTFRNKLGALADPTTVTFKYRKPGASAITTLVYSTDVEVVRDSLGVYHCDIASAAGEHGAWAFRWESTGDPATADEDSFTVDNSGFD